MSVDNNEFHIPFEETRRGVDSNTEEKAALGRLGRYLGSRAINRPTIGQRRRGRGGGRGVEIATGGKPGTRNPTGSRRDVDGDGWADEGTTRPVFVGIGNTEPTPKPKPQAQRQTANRDKTEVAKKLSSGLEQLSPLERYNYGPLIAAKKIKSKDTEYRLVIRADFDIGIYLESDFNKARDVLVERFNKLGANPFNDKPSPLGPEDVDDKDVLRFMLNNDKTIKVMSAMQTWSPGDGSRTEVFQINTRPKHQRRGLAAEMFNTFRELYPELDLQHSDALSEDGRAFAKAVPATSNMESPDRPSSLSSGKKYQEIVDSQPELSEEKLRQIDELNELLRSDLLDSDDSYSEDTDVFGAGVDILNDSPERAAQRKRVHDLLREIFNGEIELEEDIIVTANNGEKINLGKTVVVDVAESFETLGWQVEVSEVSEEDIKLVQDETFEPFLSADFANNGLAARFQIKLTPTADAAKRLAEAGVPDEMIWDEMLSVGPGIQGEVQFGRSVRMLSFFPGDKPAVTMQHETFFLNSESQGHGIGSAFNARNEKIYEAIGQVKIFAAGTSNTEESIGATHWPRNGFTWAGEPGKQTFLETIAEALDDTEQNWFSPEEKARISSLIRKNPDTGLFETDSTPENLLKFQRATELFKEKELSILYVREVSERKTPAGALSSGRIGTVETEPVEMMRSAEFSELSTKLIDSGGTPDPTSILREYMEFPVYEIDGKKFAFGNIDLGRFQPEFDTEDIEIVPFNPYLITGLPKTSAEGQEWALKMFHAIQAVSLLDDFQAGRVGNKKVGLVAALTYAAKRGDKPALEELERLAKIGEELLSNDRRDTISAAKRYNEEMWDVDATYWDQVPNIQVVLGPTKTNEYNDSVRVTRPVGIDDLFLVHQTSYKPQYDADGNIILKPTGDFIPIDPDTGEQVLDRISGKPVAMPDRDTVHFALNHMVTGHMWRSEPTESTSVIVVPLRDVLDANPGSLDNLFVVDTFLTPKPGEGLVIPMKNGKVVEGSGKELRESVHNTLLEVGKLHNQHDEYITNTFLGGESHSEMPNADNRVGVIALQDIPKEYPEYTEGVLGSPHADHPSMHLATYDNAYVNMAGARMAAFDYGRLSTNAKLRIYDSNSDKYSSARIETIYEESTFSSGRVQRRTPKSGANLADAFDEPRGVTQEEATRTGSSLEVLTGKKVTGRIIEKIEEKTGTKLTTNQKSTIKNVIPGLLNEIAEKKLLDIEVSDAFSEIGEQLLSSIAINISSDGIPFVSADPIPQLAEQIPDKRDWRTVELPKRDDVISILDEAMKDTVVFDGSTWKDTDGNVIARKVYKDDASTLEYENDEARTRFPMLEMIAPKGFVIRGDDIGLFSFRQNIIPKPYLEAWQKHSQFITELSRRAGELMGDEGYFVPGSRITTPTSTYLRGYIGGIADPHKFNMGLAGKELQDSHDLFGHLGTGRGFDRHGEWANDLAMMSIVDHPDSPLTPREKLAVKHLTYMLYSASRMLRVGRLDESVSVRLMSENDLDKARDVFNIITLTESASSKIRVYAGDFNSVIRKLDAASTTKGLSSGRKSIYEADPEDVKLALAYDVLGKSDRLASGRERPRILARPILRRRPLEPGRRAVKGYGQPDASGKEVRRNSNKWLSGMTPEEISRVIVPTSQAEHFEMWADDMAGGSWKTNSKEREFLQKYYDELRANKNSLDIDYSPENIKITQETVRGMLESSPQMLWMFENFSAPMIVSFTREAMAGFEDSPEMKERLELNRQQRGIEKPGFISGLSSPAFGLIGLAPRALIDRESMTTDEKGVYPINLDPARIPQPRDAHVDRSLHGVIMHEYGHWLHYRAAWDSEANGKTRKEKSFYGSGDISDPRYVAALEVADEYMNPDADNEAIKIWSEFIDLTERSAEEMFRANRDKALTATSYGNVNKREAIAEAFVAIMHPNKDMPKLALSKKLRDDVYALAGVDPNNLPWAARADGRPTIRLSSDVAPGVATEDARPLISRLLDVIRTDKDRPISSSGKESLSSGKKPHTPKWKSVEDIVDFEALGASSDDSTEEIEEVVRESLRDWEEWNPCRQIRVASYELAGIQEYSDRDPNITQTDGFFGNSRYETAVSPERRTEQARYIMASVVDSLLNQDKYDRQPYLYRAMTFSSPQEAKQFFDAMQVGAQVDIPLIAFVDKGPSPSGGHFLTKFGTDALLVLEDFPGAYKAEGKFEPLFSNTDESDTLYNIDEFAESILADIERGVIDEERIELDTEFANRLIKLVEDYRESRDPSERRRLKTEMGEALEETGNESINLEWEGEPLPEDHEDFYFDLEDEDSNRSAREHISGGRLEVVSVEPDPAGLYKEVVTLRQIGAFDPQEKGALVLKTDGQPRRAALSSGNRNNSYNLVAIETDDSTPEMLESLKEKLGDALVGHETSTVDLGTRGQTNVRKKHTFTISSEKLRNTHAHNYATNRSFMAQIQELSSGAKPPQYPRKPTMGAFVGSADSEFDGITNWEDFKRAIADKEIVFIDYETTGLKFNEFNESAGNGSPTQIGAVKMKNGKVVARFNVFVNPGMPMSEWEKWSQDNLKDGDGNPITDAYLADKPSIAEAHKQLVEFMGDTELMGMQNAVFDNEVLEDALKESGIEWRPKGIIDTKEVSDMVLPKWSETNPDAPFRVNKDGTKAPSNSLGDITKYLGVDLGDKHHNADADAEATAKVLQAIIDGAIENGWPADVLDKGKRRDKENKTQIKFEKAVSEFEDAKKAFIEGSGQAPLSSGDTLSSGSTILSQWLDVTSSDSFGDSGSELRNTFGRTDLEKLQKVLQDEQSALSKTIDEWQKTGTWSGGTNGVAMPRVKNPKKSITRNISAEELSGMGDKDALISTFDGYLSQINKQLDHINDRLANLDRMENDEDIAHVNAISIKDLPNLAALAERGKKIKESRGPLEDREWSLTKDDPNATWLVHTGTAILDGGVLEPSFTLPRGGDGTPQRAGMNTQGLNAETRDSIIGRYEAAEQNFNAYQLALKEYDETGVWDGPKLLRNSAVAGKDRGRREYGTYVEGQDDEKISPKYLRDIARGYIDDGQRVMARYEYAYPLAKAGEEYLSYDHPSQGSSRGYVRNDSPTSKTYLIRVPNAEVVNDFPGNEYQIFGTRTPIASFEVPNNFNVRNMSEVEYASIALFEEAAQKHISRDKLLKDLGVDAPVERTSLSSGDNTGRLLRSMQLHDDEFEKKYNQKVPDGDGDCFTEAVEQARDLAEAYDGIKIAHGYPLGTGGDAKGLRFPHAWNEFTRDGIEWVRDYSNGNEVEIPKAVYYAIGNIAQQDVSVFSLEEAEKSMSENGHYGPWTGSNNEASATKIDLNVLYDNDVPGELESYLGSTALQSLENWIYNAKYPTQWLEEVAGKDYEYEEHYQTLQSRLIEANFPDTVTVIRQGTPDSRGDIRSGSIIEGWTGGAIDALNHYGSDRKIFVSKVPRKNIIGLGHLEEGELFYKTEGVTVTELKR